MDNFAELMDLAEAYVEPVIDEFYRRLLERDYVQDDPEVAKLTAALPNILMHDNRENRPTEVLLMAACVERTKQQLVEAAGRLVTNRSVPGSGLPAP